MPHISILRCGNPPTSRTGESRGLQTPGGNESLCPIHRGSFAMSGRRGLGRQPTLSFQKAMSANEAGSHISILRCGNPPTSRTGESRSLQTPGGNESLCPIHRGSFAMSGRRGLGRQPTLSFQKAMSANEAGAPHLDSEMWESTNFPHRKEQGPSGP